MSKPILRPHKRINGFGSKYKEFVGKKITVMGTRLSRGELLDVLLNNIERKFVGVTDFCNRFGISLNTYYAVIKSARSSRPSTQHYTRLVSMCDFSKAYTSKSMLVLNYKQANLLRQMILADFGTYELAASGLNVPICSLCKYIGNSARYKLNDKVNCMRLYEVLVSEGYINIG